MREDPRRRTALAGCAPREATAPSAAPSVVVPAAPPLDADGYTFTDDPLQLGPRYAVGAVEVRKVDDGITTMDPGR